MVALVQVGYIYIYKYSHKKVNDAVFQFKINVKLQSRFSDFAMSFVLDDRFG